MDEDERITGEALHWHAGLARDDADWGGFTAWLEADPRHRAAYDAVARVEDALERHRETLAQVLPAEDAPRRRRAWWWGGGLGLGAAVAAGAALLLVPATPDPARIYQTAPGQTRSIALADGGKVELAAASRLTLLPGDRMTLVGAATFDVPHRPERTLAIKAGGLTVTDIGTVFEIAADGPLIRVAVAEGRVRVGGAGFAAPVALPAGRRMIVDRAHNLVEEGALRDFAAWRQGRLVYENVPLPLVAAEVGRHAGVRITLAPALAARRFSGVLSIGDGVVDDLARFMGVAARRDASGVRLEPRAGGGA